MKPDDDAGPAAGETFHDGEVPQGAVTVEARHGCDAGEVEQRPEVPGRGDCGAPDVERQVEVGVDDPLRRCEPRQRDLGEPVAEPQDLPARAIHPLDQAVPVGRPIEYDDAADRGTQERSTFDRPGQRVGVVHVQTTGHRGLQGTTM